MESSGTPAPSPGDAVPPSGGHDYPLTFSVDYPDRSLNGISTAFRIFTIIPIAILAATIEGGGFGAQAGGEGVRFAGGGIGILVIPVLLMLLSRGGSRSSTGGRPQTRPCRAVLRDQLVRTRSAAIVAAAPWVPRGFAAALLR
jgi:hypothetical protein